ncbi:MAG: hypothetical protein JWM04_1153 [Verrucomicrobiales bacterium]|nr:hypothetical protein [Verrucomicrobiales bacterium]
MGLKLSSLSIILGFLFAAAHLYALLNPKKFSIMARKFPRSTPIGFFLLLVSTAWFVWNLKNEPIADFESWKPVLYTLFMAVGIGSCVFVRDFLAVRGIAVLMLLVAKLMVDLARWEDTRWRLVVVVWAYGWVFLGMWFTIAPWRMRDLIWWHTESPSRLKLFSAVRLAFGIFVLALGFTVFKQSEKQEPPATVSSAAPQAVPRG